MTDLIGNSSIVTRSKEIAKYLSPVVANLTALSVDAKQAHWHVRGPNFLQIHELLDTVVDHAREQTDIVAERIVALGEPLDARIQWLAKVTTTPELPAGFQNTDVFIEGIVSQIDATLKLVRGAIDALDDIDLPSQDIVIALATELEKDRWFLASHLVTK
ncbi:MAG: DNA starvation/stationary phase protection protein [Microbacteriaceae bacterium]|nr:DNA starvation/stationary phase protection protein [Microbacteriaceae bacterium]